MKSLSILRTMTVGKTSVGAVGRPRRKRKVLSILDLSLAGLPPIAAAILLARDASRGVSSLPFLFSGRARNVLPQRTPPAAARPVSGDSCRAAPHGSIASVRRRSPRRSCMTSALGIQ